MLEAIYIRVQLWRALGIIKNLFFIIFDPNMASPNGTRTPQGPSEDPPGPHFGKKLDPKFDRFLIKFQRILESPRAHSK